jgi:hypothetical protein
MALRTSTNLDVGVHWRVLAIEALSRREARDQMVPIADNFTIAGHASRLKGGEVFPDTGIAVICGTVTANHGIRVLELVFDDTKRSGRGG